MTYPPQVEHTHDPGGHPPSGLYSFILVHHPPLAVHKHSGIHTTHPPNSVDVNPYGIRTYGEGPRPLNVTPYVVRTYDDSIGGVWHSITPHYMYHYCCTLYPPM